MNQLKLSIKITDELNTILYSNEGKLNVPSDLVEELLEDFRKHFERMFEIDLSYFYERP